MKKIISLTAFVTMAAVLVSVSSWAQSPAATATGKTSGGANVTIKYGSPSVKGRKIWGGLVPYDKVWRAGANEATVLETDKDITVEGKAIPKGKYSVYMIPGEKEWSIIINSQTGQWGINRDQSTTRDASKDVAVVKVKPRASSTKNEALKYTIDDKGISLWWENLEVPIAVK
jgi:hypothetical protein